MIANSATRVIDQTDETVNEQIHRFTDTNIAYFASHPEEIDQRLDELDQEWDIERALETVASSLSIFGLMMGILGRRRWLLLPAVVQGFFLQHAIQGWCPPLPALRRMGFRTVGEIEAERYALKAIKGDFRGVADVEGEEDDSCSRADKVMRAIRGEQGGRIGALRNAGSTENRRSKPSKNPGPKGGSKSKPKGESVSTDVENKSGEEGIPQPDVGPTS